MFDLDEPLRVVGKKLGVENPNHRAAGARWSDDVFGVIKQVEQLPGDLACLIPVTGVKSWLAATGLGWIKGHVHPQAPQHLDDALTDVGSKLVSQAGDEERNSGSRSRHWKEMAKWQNTQRYLKFIEGSRSGSTNPWGARGAPFRRGTPRDSFSLREFGTHRSCVTAP